MTNIERIWLSEPDECNYHEVWFDSDYGGTEYIRTDLVAVNVQPDPREEIIEALVDALHAIELWDAARGYPIPYRHRDPMRAALAAAKEMAK